MKKRIIALMCLIVLTLSLAACGSKPATNQSKNNDDTLIGNNVFNEEKVISVTGKEINLAQEYDAGRVFVDTNIGAGIILAEDLCEGMRIHDVVPLFQYESNNNQMDLSFLGEKLMNPTEESASDNNEEDIEEYLTTCFPLLAIYKVGADETPMTAGIYDSAEEIGSWNGDRYFILYNKNMDEDVYSGLTDKDKQNIRDIIEAVPEIKKNMFVFPAEVIADNTDELKASSAFSSFTAQDVFGNEITDEIIKENDITMINIWATWCGPCVMEMKDLGELYFNLPDGVGLISICIDSDTEAEFAKEILDKNGCEFTTLVPSGEIKDFVDEVYSFPTTIFVDRSGTVIETTADANDMEGYLSIINALK